MDVVNDYRDEHRAPHNDGAWQKAYLNGEYDEMLDCGAGYSVNLVDFFREGIEPYKGCRQDMEYMYDYDNGASKRVLDLFGTMLQTPGSTHIPTVTIYRTVPNSVMGNDDVIHDGDWICLSRQYAKEHGDLRYTDNYHVLTMSVPANHIYWDGEHLSEFGYDSREFEWNKTSEVLKNVSEIITDATTRSGNANETNSKDELDIVR